MVPDESTILECALLRLQLTKRCCVETIVQFQFLLSIFVLELQYPSSSYGNGLVQNAITEAVFYIMRGTYSKMYVPFELHLFDIALPAAI